MLSTPRLRVRRITADDYEAMLRVYGDREAMEFVDDGEPISPDDTRRWIEVTQKNYETRGYGMSAVEHLESSEVIGFAGLVHPGGQETPELKYAYAREHWGQGYATEAGRALIEWGAAEFGMTRIIATTSPQNVPSHRVLIKCGMVDEGITEDDGESIQTFGWGAGG